MKIVFSRKGFDSSAGGCPSPIIDGRPVVLPIPEAPPSPTTYDALGLGEIVEAVTAGRIARHANCHDDPMFDGGYWWFGQAGSAQGHLRKQGVGPGDIFLFFGLFADPGTGERHHRIFGHMTIRCCGSPLEITRQPGWQPPARAHPHLGGKDRNANTIYFGEGALARKAHRQLRLTKPGGPLNRWTVPSWLQEFGLSYHAKPERWIGTQELDTVKRGQEFVCDIGDAAEPLRWLEEILRAFR